MTIHIHLKTDLGTDRDPVVVTPNFDQKLLRIILNSWLYPLSTPLTVYAGGDSRWALFGSLSSHWANLNCLPSIWFSHLCRSKSFSLTSSRSVVYNTVASWAHKTNRNRIKEKVRLCMMLNSSLMDQIINHIYFISDRSQWQQIRRQLWSLKRLIWKSGKGPKYLSTVINVIHTPVFSRKTGKGP